MKALKFYIDRYNIILITAFLIAVLLLLLQLYKISKELDNLKLSHDAVNIELDNRNKMTDSLVNEVFIHKTNQERYEVAIDLFKDENPIAHKQLEYILYNKTE